MSRKNSFTSILQIIALMASQREVYQLKMAEKAELSYKTVIENLKLIEAMKLATCREKHSKNGGKPSKIYRITLKGLCFYLTEFHSDTDLITSKKARTQLKKIINNFPEMLLFFKKWPLFSEPPLQEKMLDLFVYNLRANFVHYTVLIEQCLLIMPEQKLCEALQAADRDLAKNIDKETLVGALQIPDMKEKLKAIYLKDQELKDYVTSEITKTKKELEQIEEIKSFMFKGS